MELGLVQCSLLELAALLLLEGWSARALA